MAADSVLYPEKVDISNCAKEPIHIIGKSQAHGVIVACNAGTLEISQCSENALPHFKISHEDLLGKQIEELLGSEREKELRTTLQEKKPFLPDEMEINGRNFLTLPHLSFGNLIIDFEPLMEEHNPILFQRQLSKILNNLRAAGTVEELCREAAALTSGLFEYDRVMVYKFDEEWNGEVVAEEKREEADSWLGLRYPASDIPAQARKMFLKNRVRIIADVNYEPVPVVHEISLVTNQPLDLSGSGLRAVSPIHIEYLQNMKVGASLTVGVVVDGKLWGLVACHHNSAKYINYYQRESCHFLTQMFSNELALRETNRFLEKTGVSGEIREKLVLHMKQEENPVQALTAFETKFTDLISCGGGGIFINGKLNLIGTTPSEEEVQELIFQFLDVQEENLCFSKNLSEVFPEAKRYRDRASGILSLRIENNYMIWFRPEVVQTVNWGGDPEKKVTFNEEKKRLSPRKSFEKWSES